MLEIIIERLLFFFFFKFGEYIDVACAPWREQTTSKLLVVTKTIAYLKPRHSDNNALFLIHKNKIRSRESGPIPSLSSLCRKH